MVLDPEKFLRLLGQVKPKALCLTATVYESIDFTVVSE